MLTETFITSISAAAKAPNTSSQTKDAAIFLHEFQPLAAQRAVFKKSATPANCLAVSASHVFAAQAEKAVVHVYSREKGNQEAIVPFPERIHSLALACHDTVLVLGTEGGRIFLWETCTGRQVTTPQYHLQPITILAIDPTSSFLLSGSADSNIHVWSLPSLLSFSTPSSQRTPLHTLSSHRGAITALATGHSSTPANIAVSASTDSTAIVWDYHTGAQLRTYLLGTPPLALVLDATDTAFYAGYADGSVQVVEFFPRGAGQAQTAVDTLRDADAAVAPVQPPLSTRWHAENQDLGAAHCVALSWDGSTLLSGHESGKLGAWDTGRGGFRSVVAMLPGPVTNLRFLPVTGWPVVPGREMEEPSFRVHSVVKPKLDSGGGAPQNSGVVPGNYTFTAQFVSTLPTLRFSADEDVEIGFGARGSKRRKTAFEEALTHTSFPAALLEEGIAELAEWVERQSAGSAPGAAVNGAEGNAVEADFMALDDTEGKAPRDTKLMDENMRLKKQLRALQRVQKATFGQIADLREEVKGLREMGREEEEEDDEDEDEGEEDNDEDDDMRGEDEELVETRRWDRESRKLGRGLKGLSGARKYEGSDESAEESRSRRKR
ncbi:Pre-rRNA-processing protein ipi3 [Coniosporium apollinis]|uniref:Pre-rRNA-processing protein IPI3 n=1 Tax=Coniosporium apollinis TaxID=61459 RepID=A0ABQ9NLC8_9PEZI|nr:Pre-rRNA-processing protein ipi3 [Coniosporium apollinis]